MTELPSHFMDRVMPIPESGCWIFMGEITTAGYGMYSNKELETPRNRMLAHRYAYEKGRGPIPKGLHIDHLCRVRCCVNPNHMEAVTHKENILRGISHTAINAKKTHCIRGHEFNDKNTYVYSNGYRGCKKCLAMHAARYRAQKKGAIQ